MNRNESLKGDMMNGEETMKKQIINDLTGDCDHCICMKCYQYGVHVCDPCVVLVEKDVSCDNIDNDKEKGCFIMPDAELIDVRNEDNRIVDEKDDMDVPF